MSKYELKDQCSPQAIADDLTDYLFGADPMPVDDLDAVDRQVTAQQWYEDILENVSPSRLEAIRAELNRVTSLTIDEAAEMIADSMIHNPPTDEHPVGERSSFDIVEIDGEKRLRRRTQEDIKGAIDVDAPEASVGYFVD